MMGSVGLKGPGAAAAIARQRMTAMSRSSRSISTVRSQTLRLPGQRGQLKSVLSGNASWRMAPAVVGPAAIRFNSTSSGPTPAEIIPDRLPADQLTDVPNVYDITTIPERIGYLHDLGLDYGWGPAAIMQYVIEHVHIWSGMPWWASIVAVGVMSRAVLFKAVMNASENAARMNNIKDKVDPLRKRMIELGREGNQQETQVVRAQLAEINKQHGITMWRSLIPMLQMPIGFGMFRVVRGMTSLPVPALATETVAWLNDLTIADPTYTLPIIASVALGLTLKRGGETGAMPMMESSAGKAIMYGLPAISFTFMAFMPSALQLYFVATGIFGLGQTYVINSTSFRNLTGMTNFKKTGATKLEINSDIRSKGLRAALLRVEEEKAAQRKAREQISQQPLEGGAAKISWIDSVMNKGKDLGKNVSKEISEKFGTSTLEERQLKEQKKRAGEYEGERKLEDDAKRAERNEIRRKEHLKILEKERNKASQSLKKDNRQRGPRRG